MWKLIPSKIVQILFAPASVCVCTCVWYFGTPEKGSWTESEKVAVTQANFLKSRIPGDSWLCPPEQVKSTLPIYFSSVALGG